MSKHTPGPWEINPQTCGDADISVYATLGSGNPHWVARAYGGGPLAPPSPVTAANARLIAAAPEMLAALEFAYQELETAHRFKVGLINPECLGDARDAIAKAKESPC